MHILSSLLSIIAQAESNHDIIGAIGNITTWMQLIIQIATVATLIYTLARFVSKPNQTQDRRLDDLERWKDSVECRLNRGNDHFARADDTTRVMIESQLAIMDALTAIPELPQTTKDHLLSKRSDIYRSIASSVSE